MCFKKITNWLGFGSVGDIICTFILTVTLIILLLIFCVIANISSYFDHGEIIESIKSGKYLEYQFEYISIMLGCITISISLSTAFPYFITRLITAKKVEEIIEDRVLNTKNNILTESIEKIFDEKFPEEKTDRLMRWDGDYARMTSFFLFTHEKYMWAIGWACRGLSRYHKCNEKSISADIYREFEKQCIDNITACISHYIAFNEKFFSDIDIDTNQLEKIFTTGNKDDDNYKIARRTLTSLIDYRLIRSKFNDEAGNKHFIYNRFPETKEQTMLIDIFIAILAWSIPKQILDSESKRYYFKDNPNKFKKVIEDTAYYNKGSINKDTIKLIAEISKEHISTYLPSTIFHRSC